MEEVLVTLTKTKEKQRYKKIKKTIDTFTDHLTSQDGGSRGVIVKAMDCRIVVSEFVLQSRYYVHFRANTLGKGMNPLMLPAMG